MDIALRTLRYLVATAETGSVSAAARRLNISQPSVSAAIAQIEAQLGVQLFLRVPTKGMRLTEDGAAVLREARSLLGQAEEFRSRAGAIATEMAGEISFACFVNLSPTVMGDILGAFKARHPAISVNFHDADHHEILDALVSGTVEMALSFDLETHPSVESRRVAAYPPQAILAADDPLASQTSVTMGDLATRSFILMDLPHTRDYFVNLFEALGIDIDVAYRCRSFEAVRAFVASGLGVSILSLQPAINLTYSGKSVVVRPITEALPPLHAVLLRNRRLKPRRTAAALANFVANEMARMGDPRGHCDRE